MSLLSQASLVVVPSGYKEDVVYSVKPTDGSGDLTFTRASDGTRVNSQGYVERVPWNLVQQSNTLNTTWSQINISVTSGQSGYDGSSDAWLLTTAASQGRVQQTLPTTSGVYTLSCYMKQGTNTRGVIRMNQGGSEFVAYFELDSGTAAAVSGNVIASAIESVGGGWYRCSAAFITATSSNSIGFGSAASGSNWTATTSGNIYIQDAQLNEGSTAKPYFPTTDRLNVPRLDYSGGCPSLLLEPQRTNLVTYSEQFDNAAWLKIRTSVTANATTAPDGTSTADKMQDADTTSGDHLTFQTPTTIGVIYTFSGYFKKSEYNFVTLHAFGLTGGTFNLDTGVVVSSVGGVSSIVAEANGWYRCSFTFTAGGTSVFISQSPSGNKNYTGTIGSGIFVWGAQLESGPYPTSYIPTTSASVTRVADAASKTGISSLIGQTEGVLFVDFVPNNTPVSGVQQWLFFLGSGSAYIAIFISSGQKLRANVANTTDQAIIDTSFNLVAGTRYKAALAYKENDFAFYVNGAQIGVDTSGTVPAVSSLRNNYTTTAANSSNAGLNQAVLFKTRLSNTDLASLTTL